VAKAVGAWLASKERAPGARANSIASYRGRARHLVAYFNGDQVRHVRPEHLSRFAHDLLEEGSAPATTQSIYSALTAVLRTLSAAG
jgi:Phage integrase, N-terminal SAM-like domain